LRFVIIRSIPGLRAEVALCSSISSFTGIARCGETA